MSFFNYSGFRLSYHIRGEGKDIVFMHGLGADKRQSLSALSGLSGYRAICMDAPGHGESFALEGSESCSPYGFVFFAKAVLALLDELGIETAFFGGISMGSGISLRIALDAPDRVEGLLLVRPAWLDTAGLPQLRIVADLGEWIESEGLAVAESRLKEDPLYRLALAGNPSCAASIAGVLTRPRAVETADVLYKMVHDAPVRSLSELEAVSQPAIVFGNEGDPLHPLEIACEVAKAVRNGRFVKLPSRYLEAKAHQERLTEELQAFLDEKIFHINER